MGVLSFYLECLFSVFLFGEPLLSYWNKDWEEAIGGVVTPHFLTFCTLTLQRTNTVDATGTLWKINFSDKITREVKRFYRLSLGFNLPNLPEIWRAIFFDWFRRPDIAGLLSCWCFSECFTTYGSISSKNHGNMSTLYIFVHNIYLFLFIVE